MAMIRWKPFSDIDQFLDDLSLSQSSQAAFDLSADIYQEDGDVIIEMNTAGINPEGIDITVEDDHVRIYGSREDEDVSENRDYFVKEIRRGDFERIIDLPCPVLADEASAEFEDGVLKVTLPKANKKNARKVEVKKDKNKNKSNKTGQIQAKKTKQDKAYSLDSDQNKRAKQTKSNQLKSDNLGQNKSNKNKIKAKKS